MSDSPVLFYCHQVDDPYSHLLAQALPPVLERYGARLDPRLVPPPEPEMVPRPGLQAQWARRDAADLARFYPVRFPADAAAPDPELVRQANRILANVAAGDFAAVAVDLGDALWAGEAGRMERLAGAHGTLDDAATAQRLAANAAERRARGHYQGGMLCLDGEWFWGLDRLDLLEERLRAVTGRHDGPPVFTTRDPEAFPAPAPDTPRRLEVWFSFRSPYSYLAIKRLPALVERCGVEPVVKPVLPMVMRGLPVPPAKAAYIVRDTLREAGRHGIPFGRFHDPVGPGVERAMALFDLAREQGRVLPYLDSVATGIWAEAVDTASDEGLASLVARAGLDWSRARPRLADPNWRGWAERHQQELFAMGLWGVPSFRLGDYGTWGQDRMWMIEARLRKLSGPA
ncbi:MAG TPA: DsbA family protein [Gammaproteobacteria bacterium]|nr:DsbA family protein [Gammaproteobacteria bacterium]